MKRFRLYALAALCAFLPGLQLVINTMRERIVPTRNVYLAVTPGEFAGTLLLGGFRAVAVDVLWIRVDRLQREGDYFEIVALSDMIAKLQPHDRMVWEFISWNRAYNISAEYPNSREDRWKWVRSGIEKNLEGIRRLPGNWKLYKHLAFMLSHKCADYEEETLRDFGMDNDTMARIYYRKALRLNPDAPLYIRRAIIHTYEKQGRFERALELYRRHLKTYPHDPIAKVNMEQFLQEKQRYSQNMGDLKRAYRDKSYERVIEIYEDYIIGEPYPLTSDSIEMILFSYMNTHHFDSGIRFIHRRMNLKMDRPKRIYALYEQYTDRYNRYYGRRIKELHEKGDHKEIYTMYKEKFKEKKVDISLNNGIMVAEAMISTEFFREAESIITELLKWNPEHEELKRLKSIVQEMHVKRVKE